MAIVALAADATQASAQRVIEVPFGGANSHPEQILDIYVPHDHLPGMPVHLYVHGGAWSLGDPRIRRRLARAYTNDGVILASLGYRLAPAHQHPDHVRDIALAIRWVVDNIAEYGGDANRMVLSGHSAGAHLAALVATHPSYLAEVDLSPQRLRLVVPVDTASLDLRQRHELPMIQRLRDSAFTTMPEALSDASPTVQVDRSGVTTKFHLFVSAERQDAIRQARDFVQTVEARGGAAILTPLENHTHRQMRRAIFSKDSPIHNAILGAFDR